MAGRSRIRLLLLCIVMAGILFYTWPFENDRLWPAVDDPELYFLAQDALQAARGSVLTAMRSFSGTHENNLQNNSRQDASTSRLLTKLERLQASLDGLDRRPPPFRDTALDALPRERSVSARLEFDMCASLAGKRVAMIGGEHVFRLHRLLLQHRERAEGRLFPCPYHEFCTHHHICLPDQPDRDDSPSPPPPPPSRYVRSPTEQELIDTESAAVNYIVSDALSTERNASSWTYTSPVVDPMTGVRLRETYWLGAARKAHIVILGRGPLSPPGQTYAGNWSFLRPTPGGGGERRRPSPSRAARAALALGGGHARHDTDTDATAPRALDLLHAAVHLTSTRFVPDVVRLLRTLQTEVRPSRRRRWIWPGGWYRLPGRGRARCALRRLRPGLGAPNLPDRTVSAHLAAMLRADADAAARLEDPWTLLFNAQVYLQNAVLRAVLPQHGIAFLPLDDVSPWAEDRRQLRGRARRRRDTELEAEDAATTIGDAFVTRMDYILQYLG